MAFAEFCQNMYAIKKFVVYLNSNYAYQNYNNYICSLLLMLVSKNFLSAKEQL